jgi:hypothetical protein
MEKRIYTGLPTDLVPIGPTQYAEMMGVTRATACNWARNCYEGKSELPANVKKVERMGGVWVLHVPAEWAKSVTDVT